MNFLDGLKSDVNYTYTENGAVTHKTTMSKVLDMFAMGGAYRNRTDKDVEEIFGDAYRENADLAMKCLFYLRDVRGGQGERRFFRVAYKWLVRNDIEVATKNVKYIAEYGRWDDLIDICFDTSLKVLMAEYIMHQLHEDIFGKGTPSLLAKWMPSENASSKETKRRAKWFIKMLFGGDAKLYRKTLSNLRKKIKVLETTMSANEWDNIEFDKIPSVAGLKYQHAFSTREETKERYAEFMSSGVTRVNAAVLNPVDIAKRVLNNGHFNGRFKGTDADRAALNKYWDNLKDYYQGREENAIAVIDVSGSMYGTPLCAAVGMGAYVATKSYGPFANHFITFSHRPQLVEFNGDDIVDKMTRCAGADWGMNTNIEAVMDLLLDSAIKHNMSQKDLPQRLYIFSDMEFDRAVSTNSSYEYFGYGVNKETLFENIEKKWRRAGYEMPKITFWNLDARHSNIPAIGDKFNYISGFSMSQMEAVMAGKTAYDMMLEVLLNDRYKVISA